MAMRKPSPSLPSRFSTGTGQLSKITSAVCAPRWPILRSGGPIERPGVPASTMKALMPAAPEPSGPVRASTVKTPASGALVMNRLVPFST